MKTKYLEWSGSTLAVIGASLLAMNNVYSAYGYLFFLASAAILVAYSFKVRANGLFFMQLVFLIVNLVGIYRWLLQPLERL